MIRHSAIHRALTAAITALCIAVFAAAAHADRQASFDFPDPVVYATGTATDSLPLTPPPESTPAPPPDFADEESIDEPQLAPDPDAERIIIDSADYFRYEKETRTTTLRGNIRLKYKNTEIIADEAVVDDRSKTAFASGSVSIDDPDFRITGRSVLYHFKKEYFELFDVNGSTTSPTASGTIYFKGRHAAGTRSRLRLEKVTFTTCGPDCTREYHAVSKSATIFPGKKLIARHSIFYIRTTPAMYIPYYVASLKDRDGWTPEFGYDKVRGFYMLSKYPYLSKELVSGWIIFNYMQKKGIEYGAQHEYSLKALGGKGSSSYTTNKERDTGYTSTSASLAQDYKINRVSGNLTYNRSNSFNIYYPSSRTNSNRLSTSFNFVQSPSRSLTGQYQFSADKTSSPVKNQSLSLTRNVNFTKKLNLNYTYRQTAYASGANPENLESYLTSTLKYTSKLYTLSVAGQKSFDPDGDSYPNDRTVMVSDYRLPEARLQLQPAAFGPLGPKSIFPITEFSLIHGRYRQGTRADSEAIRRTGIEIAASRALKYGNRLTITPTQRLRQYFYSTKDARYIMSHNTSLAYNFTKFTSLNSSYSTTRDSGGAPYSGDTSGETSLVSGNITMKKPATQFRIATSYNYITYLYSPLETSYTRAITQNSTFVITARNDLNISKWEDTTTDLRVGRKNTKIVAAAAWDSYDLELRRMSFTTEHTRNNGWKFQVRGAIEQNSQYPIIRDVIATHTQCCTQYQFSYNTENDEFKFQYIILAFPSRKFGFTQNKQGLELDESIFQLNNKTSN